LSASLLAYVEQLSSVSTFEPGATEIFAKVLTRNDDSGRHGVLIPNEAYSFFPVLPITDTSENATVLFPAMDAVEQRDQIYGWKYYQRYPERRVTRLNSATNDMAHGKRLLIVTRYKSRSGIDSYIFDASVEGIDPRFETLIGLLFGSAVPSGPGAFVRLPVAGSPFAIDETLDELLQHFDRISGLGWIDSLRSGDTGIGYTFETLAGIEENNDRDADFKGIEIKCKLRKQGMASGKTNLFQQAPVWATKIPARERLRQLGQQRADGLYACYSQLTTTTNNLGLRIDIEPQPGNLMLRKHDMDVGHWTREVLAQRLAEKHTRAVFVKADVRKFADGMRYRYVDLVYCERPDITRFVEMVEARKIVFEFTMSEKASGAIRNHGYPWRLNEQAWLDQLFALHVQLRGQAC
jgi:hypothetical protein